MVLVDKENVKGYVQMDEKEHTKKEYASKGLAGTALGLGIGGLAVSLLNNGCNPLGIFGRNCGTNAGEVAIADNGKVCKGEIYNYDCAKNVFDKYVRNINSSITVWDVYVAINAQYHDYVRLYSEWFRNINKNELDNKIIESAITFYFKDEDSGSTKTWNYFKTANCVYIRFVVAAICVSKHVAAFVVYIFNTKNLLLFFVLFQVILYLLAAIILKCIII